MRTKAMSNTEAETMTASIYYTKFDLEDNDAAERARDIRGGFVDVETIDADDFETVYETVGTEDIESTDIDSLEAVYHAWQGGRAHENEVRSMMVGDIISVDEKLYIVSSIGFERLESLEDELAAIENEIMREIDEAESEHLAKQEQRFARHIDRYGWF